jgi:hypothetical protein
MSKKRIITISRSFGSGGRMIGEELARRLEYHFYDRNLLDLLSEKTGISEQGILYCFIQCHAVFCKWKTTDTAADTHLAWPGIKRQETAFWE